MHASVPGPVTLKGSNLQVPLKGLLLSGLPMGSFVLFLFFSVLLCIWGPKELVTGLEVDSVLRHKIFRIIVQKPEC